MDNLMRSERLAQRSVASIEGRGLDPDLSWFRASTRKIDRHGSIVEPSGFELADFGGTFGWGHDVYGRFDGSAPPPENVLGHIDDTDQSREFLDVGVRWAAHDLANRVRSMVEDGFINTVSVGFIPKDVGELRVDEHGEETEDEDGRLVEHYKRQELLEVSVAIIPSNQEAQALAVAKCVQAGLPEAIVRDWPGAATPPASAAAIGSDAATTLRALARLRFARGRGALGR